MNGTRLSLVCIVLLGASNLCGAQNAADLLRDIRRAGSACTVKETTEFELPVIPRALPLPDLACAIAPAELSGLLKQPDTIVIDTRAAVEFSTFHIDAALNMPWSKARLNPLFQSRQVVLVGSGESERSLYVGCADLKSAGIARIQVLRGGMSAWIADAGAVVGRPPVVVDVRELDDEGFLDALNFDGNAIFALPKVAALKPAAPQLQLLSNANIEFVARQLKRKVSAPDAAGFVALVLATGAPLKPAELKKLALAAKPYPLMVYSGGTNQFEAFLRHKSAMWAAHDRGPGQRPCSSL